MKEAADRVLVKRLKDRIFFREYFHEKVSPSQERWHVVLNGLNDRLVRDLIVELEILMNEIQYTLATIDIDNPEALDFLKSLSQILYRGKNWTSDYDDVKAISRFLWSVHTGWDWQKGYADKDIISGIIEAI